MLERGSFVVMKLAVKDGPLRKVVLFLLHLV